MENPFQSPVAESTPIFEPDEGLACPWCGGFAMGWYRKQLVSPLRRAKCQACGRRVGVSWRAFMRAGLGPGIVITALIALPVLLVAPWLAAAGAGAVLRLPDGRVLLTLVLAYYVPVFAGMAWYSYYWLRWLRLEKK